MPILSCCRDSEFLNMYVYVSHRRVIPLASWLRTWLPEQAVLLPTPSRPQLFPRLDLHHLVRHAHLPPSILTVAKVREATLTYLWASFPSSSPYAGLQAVSSNSPKVKKFPRRKIHFKGPEPLFWILCLGFPLPFYEPMSPSNLLQCRLLVYGWNPTTPQWREHMVWTAGCLGYS